MLRKMGTVAGLDNWEACDWNSIEDGEGCSHNCYTFNCCDGVFNASSLHLLSINYCTAHMGAYKYGRLLRAS